jgi:hypothetical protein
MKIPLNTAVGDRDLCAWQPVPGITWMQTRNPKHAERLARRQDGRLVARGVAGGYLRTFEFEKSLKWAMRLMARYTANETGTNAGFKRATAPGTNRAAEEVLK